MRQQFERWLFAERPWWQNHLYAAGITILLAVVPRIVGVMPGFPLSVVLLFSVVVSAVVGGFWPGVLSTFICLGVGGPVIAALRQTTYPGINWPALIWVIPFFVFSICLCLLVEALRRSARRTASSQRLYLSTLGNISDAVITTDPRGHIEYMNRAAAALLKRDLSDVVGQSFETVIDIRDESSGNKAIALTEQVRSASITVHAGSRQVLHCPDGRKVPVEATAAPVRDQSGALLNVVITLHDSSEQRRIEQAMHERLAAQERFEHIAAVVPGAVHEYRKLVDGSSQLSYASSSFKEIFGLDAETLRRNAAQLTDMIHPDDVRRVLDALAVTDRELGQVDLEYRILTPHRGLRWVALSTVPSRELDGSTLWHGVFTDVTERKLAEERLRASQLQLHTALEAGDMGVMMIDLVSGVVELDAAARRLWNLQSVPEQVLTTRHLLSVLHPDTVQAGQEELRQMTRTAHQSGTHVHSGDYRLLLADGEERWLFCRGRIYADESTGRHVKVGVIIDTTHQRRREEQRLHSQKLEALGVLAGGIAHDFNNLLLAIVGNAKLLLEDLPVGDFRRASAQEIDKAAARAGELVRRILSFSSVPESVQEQCATALGPVLEEVLGLARAVLPAAVSIHSNIPDTLPAVRADSNQVHQTLINLLTNAADAAVAVDGVIGLQVDVVDTATAAATDMPELPPGRYVRIAVSDNGRGIERDIQQRIFDPFFTTKPTGKGTGLGLATVHGIMKSLEGAVTVASEPGHGAVFSLYFPVRDLSPTTVEPAAKIQPSERKAHILYVDDEESLIYLMTRTLQRMGHRVTAYSVPEDALLSFRDNADDFDLVVSDMSMPGMSGLELAEQMLKIRRDLPFFITSGYVDAATAERAQTIGVRQMIMKPNTVDELSEVLNELLQQEKVTHA